jgi:hypothetical protein
MSHEEQNEQNTHHNASYQETSTADCCHSPNLKNFERQNEKIARLERNLQLFFSD